jgi:pentatricopeptide repeat protein
LLVSYATVIHGFALCGNVVMAQKILDEMLQHSTSKQAVRPDRVVFNAVMDAWKNNGGTQAGIRATKILRQMQQQSDPSCHPDTISYNTAIASWAHSGHSNAAPQAERLLHEMLVSFREAQATATNTLAVPNTVSYNSVLHAHAKSGHEQAASRAEAILRAMIRDAENGIVIPDVYSFTTVMDTLAKSKAVPDKALRARVLLDQLIGRGLQPSCVTFNTILNACKWIRCILSSSFLPHVLLTRTNCRCFLCSRNDRCAEA